MKTGQRERPPTDILVVSEDPGFIGEVRRRMGRYEGRVVACLGPAQSPCALEENDVCPLAIHSDVAVVDSPRSGVFTNAWSSEPAGTYAERLAQTHPNCFVVLVDAPIGFAGPTGDVAHVRSRAAALDVLEWSAGPAAQKVRGTA